LFAETLQIAQRAIILRVLHGRNMTAPEAIFFFENCLGLHYKTF